MKITKNLKVLYFLGFILALSTAFPGYIRSTFLEEFVDIRWVGLFFFANALFGLIAINFFPYFIKKISNYKLAIVIIILQILGILLLVTTNSAAWAFVFFIISGVTGYLIWINMDVFVERFTTNPTTGRIRTVYFTFINLGWVFSPLAVGYLIGEENYRLVYIIAVVFLVIALATILYNKKLLRDHVKYEHHHTWTTLKNIWKNANLRGIFSIAFLLELFYAVAVIYVPIYLHETIGFDWKIIGAIFTFMLLPFVLLEIPAGIFADKYSGEKKILSIGFMILVSAVALFFFTESSSPFVWALILFISRCGAALIEAMKESYFFKIVDVKDIDYINFFRNVSPLSYLVGSGLAIFALEFYSVEYLFLFLALVLLSGFYFTWKIQTIKK
ncbi:MFS transporter [Patescibacteria group bacterium]|nr:MFS transporter [Patescibacteria group bacterium]